MFNSYIVDLTYSNPLWLSQAFYNVACSFTVLSQCTKQPNSIQCSWHDISHDKASIPVDIASQCSYHKSGRWSPANVIYMYIGHCTCTLDVTLDPDRFMYCILSLSYKQCWKTVLIVLQMSLIKPALSCQHSLYSSAFVLHAYYSATSQSRLFSAIFWHGKSTTHRMPFCQSKTHVLYLGGVTTST